MAGVVVLTAILKADQKDIPKIIETLFGASGFITLGWFVAGIILITSVMMIWFLIRKYDKEMDRVCKERDRLQEFILNQKKS